ncbi:imidazoleglycerol-phosphate dehydratase HisB [Desulfobaculum bizertense]|uniref:Imidazoleglycerol-phosphate dehydratase n=1 Tax=Desulfobaculum bizertense DSM 18034 TaxID=1121442 RepID=A0A1T4VL09_9BACT|nr:imidazoleglycerol-phosphate dehydratase HisB [Desulfobaculum bizertense]UIJ38106.1 imidazoleglycerol-phosphate dehydratase HisB [Desulfobaculum bizertense]SKA65585.1 imidazoleglycerol-phosphate dehydratase [Desulfobaculum bizertense DSM 18034]
MKPRAARIERQTGETNITMELCLDGTGASSIKTGVGFADHMLTLIAFWAGWDLTVVCEGDIEVDAHHSLEDVGLCIGEALRDSLGGKKGIKRIGNARVPMDEALTEVDIDISGRAYLVYEDDVVPALVAGEEKDLWREFFKSLAFRAGLNLHMRYLYGRNAHHLVESACKAFGLAIREAATLTGDGVQSTKGRLD